MNIELAEMIQDNQGVNFIDFQGEVAISEIYRRGRNPPEMRILHSKDVAYFFACKSCDWLEDGSAKVTYTLQEPK